MPTIITEGKGRLALKFEFADKWLVHKYDELREDNFYNKLKGVGYKAVDFLASSDKTLLLIEVKYIIADNDRSSIRLKEEDQNYKTVVAELREKLSETEWNAVLFSNKRPYIVDEIDKKVRDTLLGLVAGGRKFDSELLKYSSALHDRKPLSVMVFLERSGALNQPEQFKSMASALQKTLEQRLSVLGDIRVAVVNTLTMPPEMAIKVTAGDILEPRQ